MKKIVKANKLFVVIIMMIILNIICMSTVKAATVVDEILNMSASELLALTKEEINEYKNKMTIAARQGKVSELSEEYAKAKEKLDKALEKKTSEELLDYNNYNPGGTVGSEKVQNIAGNILAIVRNVGIAISIVALSIIGIKYMLGSVEQKAEYKKSLIPFAVGVIMLVAGTTVVTFVNEAVNGPKLSSYDKGYNDAIQQMRDVAFYGDLVSHLSAKQMEYYGTEDEKSKEYLSGYMAGLQELIDNFSY